MSYKNNSPLSVAVGGTGDATLTANGPLYGNGTSAIQAMAAGTTGQFVGANTSAAPTWQTPSAGSGITALAVQIFTASGTYTPTSGMVSCIIECVGGGGGTSYTGGTTVSGSGGTSGGYKREVFTAATIGASQTVTVGAGGTGGTSGTPTGGNGGNSTVGSTLITAAGGTHGALATNSNQPGNTGAAGTTGTGFFSSGTGPGDAALSYATSNASDLIIGGKGGDSVFGGGAPAQAGFSSIPTLLAGINGTNYGGGASGAIGNGSNGGSGAGGIVIITEYT